MINRFLLFQIKVRRASYPDQAGHILDLYCVRLWNATLFCENYTKLYFDAKHLEKGLIMEEGFLVPFF